MNERRYWQFRAAGLMLVLSTLTGCGETVKKEDLSALIRDAAAARSSGHEDRAANSLKEAFDLLPAPGQPKRVDCINKIYPEILALALDLRQSGRFSLSKTMLDKAIEIESECTLPDKKSATALKAETEKVGDMEISLLKRADKAKEFRLELKQLKHTTRDLVKQFDSGDFEQVARDGRAHLEVLRKTRGAASNAYCDARRLVIDSMLQQGNTEGALNLLEDDVSELNRFNDRDLANADEDAVESALFLSPLLAQISDLQLCLGKENEARKNAERSIEIARILGGKANPDAATGMLVLATIMKDHGKEREALEMAKNALPLMSKVKHQHANWVRCLYTIAQLEDSLGKTSEAERDFDRLISDAERHEQRGATGVSLAIAAAFYRARGEKEKYNALKDKAIKIALNKNEPPNSARLIYETLGDSCVRASKFSEALPYFGTALKFASKLQKEVLEKKIAACKKNKSVTS